MPPTLVLIRHAQALHNVDKDYSIPDPVLSDLGINQCSQLAEALKTTLPSIGKVGLVIASPMRRTLQTAQLALGWLLEERKDLKIEACADWQENSAKPCDTGTSPAIVRKEYPTVDFSSRLDPVYPDKTSPAGARYAYSREAITGRAQHALEDLHSFSGKDDNGERADVVVVVSHSGFLRQGMTGRWFFNADFRVFDYEEGTDSGTGTGTRTGAGGKRKLKQWDLTEKGGMGWSFTEKVEVGEGLPEAEVVRKVEEAKERERVVEEGSIPDEDRVLPN